MIKKNEGEIIMNEKMIQKEEATQLYRAASKDAQMYFNALMNLAVILFKATRETPEQDQKGA